MAAPAKSFLLKGAGYALIQDPTSNLVKARLARLGDMTLDLSFESDDVFGGESLYAFDTVDKDRAQGVSFTNNEFNLDILNALGGATVSRGTSVEVPEFDEGHTVPSSVAYTFTLTKGATLVAGSDILRYADTNVYLERVTAGSEAAGKYSITTAGVVTFDKDDKGKDIQCDYRYTVSDGDSAPLLSSDLIPVVEIWHAHRFKDYAGNNMKFITHIYRAKASGKIGLELKRNTASVHKLDFKILDPGRSDDRVIHFATARV